MPFRVVSRPGEPAAADPLATPAAPAAPATPRFRVVARPADDIAPPLKPSDYATENPGDAFAIARPELATSQDIAEAPPYLSQRAPGAGMTRIESATGALAQGAAGTVATVPKELAIGRAQRSRQAATLFDRIDRGEQPTEFDLQAVPFPYGNAYIAAGPAQRARIRKTLVGTLDPRETPLYQGGEAIERAVKETLPTDPAYEGDFWTSDVPQGLGSTVGFMGAGILSRLAGIPTLAGASGLGAAANAVGQFENALNKGASLETAFKSANWGALTGTSEGLPITRLLDRLDRGTGGSVRRLLAETLKQGTEEALQEFGQTIANNASDIGLYDPERGIFTDSVEGATVGFTVGALMEFVGGLIVGRRGSHAGADTQPGAQQDQAAPVEQTLNTEDAATGATSSTTIVSTDPAAAAQALDREAAIQADAAAQRSAIPPDALPAEIVEGELPPEEPPPPVTTVVRPNRDDLAAAIADPRPLEEILAERTFAATAEWQDVPDDAILPDDVELRTLPETGIRQARAPQGSGRADAPIRLIEPEDVTRGAEITHPEPSAAQIEAGNAPMRHVKLHGLDITVETEQGGIRRSKPGAAQPWQVTMPAPYGYIRRSESSDGDKVDVYLGPDPAATDVVVVDQIDPATGKFDEPKTFIGFASTADALRAYEQAFADGSGPGRIGAVNTMPIEEFRSWVRGDGPKRAISYRPFDPLAHVDALRKYVGKTSKPITPDAIGKALGIAPDQANRVLGALAAQKDSGLVQGRAGRLRRKARSDKPRDLIAFLADIGGVRDHRGDLKALDADKLFIPGRGKLVRESGVPLDDATLFAWEEGYFPEHRSRPDIRVLMDALDRALRGQKIYSEYDSDRVVELEAKAAEAQEQERIGGARGDIEAFAKANGMTLSAEEIEAALQMVLGNGMETDEAVVEVVEESANLHYNRAREDEGHGEIHARRAEIPGPGVSQEGERPEERPDSGEAPRPAPASEQPRGAEPAAAETAEETPSALDPAEEPEEDDTPPFFALREGAPERPSLSADTPVHVVDVAKSFSGAFRGARASVQRTLLRRRGEIAVPALGGTVRLSRIGIQEAASKARSAADLEGLNAVHAILPASVYVEAVPDRRNRPNMLFRRLYAAMRLDGKLHRVKIAVREVDGRPGFYNLETVEIETPDAVSGADSAPGGTSSTPGPSGATINLGALLAGVNYDDGSPIFPDDQPSYALRDNVLQGQPPFQRRAGQGRSEQTDKKEASDPGVLSAASEAEMPAEGPRGPTGTTSTKVGDLLRGVKYEDGSPVLAGMSRLRTGEGTPSAKDALYALLRAELDRLGLTGVKLRLPAQIAGGKADATYWRQVIAVAMDTADKVGALHHEAIHALRELGVFGPAEWRALERQAQAVWIKDHRIRERYGKLGLSEEKIAEEAIADAFRAYMRGTYEPKGMIGRAFAKLRRLIEAVREALGQAGFSTWESVFEAIASGEVGARANTVAPAFEAAWSSRSDPQFAFRNRQDAVRVAREQEEATGFVHRVVRSPEEGWIVSNALVPVEIADDELTPRQRASREAYAAAFPGAPRPPPAARATTAPPARAATQADAFAEGKPESERTEAGEQLVLPGAERKSEAEIAAARRGRQKDEAEAAMKGRKRSRKTQEDAGDLPLFSTDGPRQGKLFSLRRARNTIKGPGLFGQSFAAPSETVWEFLRDRNRGLMDRLLLTGGAALDVARQKMQDKHLPLLRIQEAIARSRAQALPERLDAYLAEELFHGRTGKRLDDFQRKQVEPLVAAINEEGLTLEEVDEFLYARHAPERNAKIAEIREELPDGGSGMTNAEAEAIMQRLADADKTEKLERIAERIDAITAETRDLRLDGGLIDDETALQWQQAYRYYVPLKGFAEADPDASDDAPQRPRIGRGFDIRGEESRRAFGRETLAADILANVLTAHEEAIVRSEKNRVGQTFLHLVALNPNPAVWEVNAVTYSPRVNRHTGMVEFGPDPRYTLKDNVLAVKVKGKVYHVTIRHKGLARAMKNIGADTANGLLRTLQRLNRWFAFINTSASPEFIPTNFARDIQTGAINLQGLKTKGLTIKILLSVPRAVLASGRGVRGKESGEWTKLFHEYAKAGGKTEFFALDDIQSKRKRINRLLRNLSPTSLGKVRIAAVATEKLIQDVNAAVENGIRLSTYVHMRRAGLSEQQAASIAKNLTTNFNRKGEWAATAQALYLFYNASIQGTARMVQALKHPRVQKVVVGIIVANALLDIVNALLSPVGDDDDREYDKATDYAKSHNIRIVNPWADADAKGDAIYAVKFPLPYGYNVFAGIGRTIGEAMRSQLGIIGKPFDPLKASADMVALMLESFNPIGGGTDILRTLVPTALKPLYEIETNKNFMGTPIMPPQSPYDVPEPDSERYFRGASEPSKFFTRELNKLTGGNAVRPGAVDVSPETLDHLFQFMTGGAGAFVGRGADYFAKTLAGEEVGWDQVPFARRFVEGKNAYYTRQRYYEIRDAGQLAEAEIKMFDDSGDKAAADAADKRYRPEINALADMKNADQRLKRLRGAKKAAEADKRLTDEARKKEIDDIEARIEEEMVGVLRAYNLDVRKAREAATAP